jgi:hypothetical protein
LLIRKSPLTPYEASSICFVDTSDPVTSEDLGHCQQLIRQLRTLKSTQRSLDRAKNLLVNFSGHSEALITATAPLTSYLSQTHHISDSMHVRNCPDQKVFTMIQWTSMRLEDQVQSDKAHVAKASDLNFLLAQADTLEMGCTRVRNTSYRRPKSCCLLQDWGLQSCPSVLKMQARRRLSKLSGLLQWLSSCSPSLSFEIDQALSQLCFVVVSFHHVDAEHAISLLLVICRIHLYVCLQVVICHFTAKAGFCCFTRTHKSIDNDNQVCLGHTHPEYFRVFHVYVHRQAQ